jgi:hypothetical protein
MTMTPVNLLSQSQQCTDISGYNREVRLTGIASFVDLTYRRSEVCMVSGRSCTNVRIRERLHSCFKHE